MNAAMGIGETTYSGVRRAKAATLSGWEHCHSIETCNEESAARIEKEEKPEKKRPRAHAGEPTFAAKQHVVLSHHEPRIG